MTRAHPPKNWPANLLYLPAPEPDPQLPKAEQRNLLAVLASLKATADKGVLNYSPAPCPLVKIVAITDPQHPAFGQHRLVAAKKLQPGQLLLPYVGYMSIEPHCSQTSDYIIRLSGDIALDAELAGNEARFINDFRGVGDRPNCTFNTFIDQHGTLRMGVFVGNKPVAKGEELLVSYGKGFWKARCSDPDE